ncbi:hypothetical protein GCM10007067_03260 [Lysobacter bugurensis]|uniref:DUF72 domain-containing protein n=1 Tax=Cognatilysobacter bugurensis TaxID=543356 RepID=A0A918ST49_9GAMM|nr:hypothetical protein GCM10007067_03260 [Lysobacter bugurensis]
MSGTRPPIRIGCAGWSIASAHAALFGEGDSMLARYATRFDTVEINSSFYRPHRRQTYERWAATVPEDFRFSAKLPRAITHEARLIGADDVLDRFLDEVSGLGDRLGGVLVQLPPSLAFDARIVENFFERLRVRTDVALACEPRHRSWFVPELDALWERFDVARVAADPARVEGAGEVAGHGGWHYWRWHGSPKIYYSAYDDAALRTLADDLLVRARPGREAWCILDNTAAGHATSDAATMQALCGVEPTGAYDTPAARRPRASPPTQAHLGF